MKKALEAAVLVAVLALGAFVARQLIARRDAASGSRGGDPSLRAGPDTANPGDTYVQKPAAGVETLPMIKLSRPPKPNRRPAAVPPPAPR